MMDHRIALIVLLTFVAGQIFLAATLHADTPQAEVTHRVVSYEVDGQTYRSHLYLPAGHDASKPVPGVLVYPEWWGVNDYVRGRGQMLAELGYAALVVDLYGEAKLTQDPKQASQWAGALRNNHAIWRQRAAAGMTQLQAEPGVDRERIAAIGYCFGGTTSLQLAYTDPEGLRGIVSFHGSLTPPTEDDTISAAVMIAHGAVDPMVPDTQVATWKKAMESREHDYVFVAYAGAVHSFTNPDAGKSNIPGVAYDKKADHRSWAQMKLFLEEVLMRDSE